jgi:hypothetical protein
MGDTIQQISHIIPIARSSAQADLKQCPLQERSIAKATGNGDERMIRKYSMKPLAKSLQSHIILSR